MSFKYDKIVFYIVENKGVDVAKASNENNAYHKTEIQNSLDLKYNRQMLPKIPRNHFSSSYEHDCAMQEIMSSLQVFMEDMKIFGNY